MVRGNYNFDYLYSSIEYIKQQQQNSETEVKMRKELRNKGFYISETTDIIDFISENKELLKKVEEESNEQISSSSLEIN